MQGGLLREQLQISEGALLSMAGICISGTSRQSPCVFADHRSGVNVGQHLVSVVTGYPGGKSGARGYDLVIDDERHGEIKTCYRVDQLGSCNACGAVVSSLETECAVCRSTSINRKDDSK